jgi:multiple sugar transport system ATP-binding protein
MIAEHLGSDTVLHVSVEGIGTVKARVEGEFALRHGEKAYLTPDPGKIHRFDPEGAALR